MPFEWPLCAFSALRATLSYFDGFIYMCKYQSWFRVNQRWISAVQRWKSNVSEQRKSALNSADSELFLSETALFSSETALIFSVLNSAHSEKIRADQLCFRADQRWCLSYSLNQRWKTSKLWNSAVQRWLPLGLQPGACRINISSMRAWESYFCGLFEEGEFECDRTWFWFKFRLESICFVCMYEILRLTNFDKISSFVYKMMFDEVDRKRWKQKHATVEILGQIDRQRHLWVVLGLLSLMSRKTK